MAGDLEPTARAPSIDTLADLNGRTIGILVGTMLDIAAENTLDLVSIAFYDDYDAMELALLADEIDAIFGDEPVMRARARKNPDKLRVLDESVEESHYGFAVNHDNPDLHGHVDALVKRFLEDGTLERLRAKWLDGPEDGKIVAVSSSDQPGARLLLGTNRVLPPFSYSDRDGTITGMDMELAEMMAVELGRPLEIRVMPFGDMIPALIDGKVDMIGGAITITDDRQAVINFAEGYHRIGVAALVRKQGQ